MEIKPGPTLDGEQSNILGKLFQLMDRDAIIQMEKDLANTPISQKIDIYNGLLDQLNSNTLKATLNPPSLTSKKIREDGPLAI